MNGTSRRFNYRALGFAVVLCVCVAVVEGLLGTEGLRNWYAELAKPDWHLPIWGFVVVAIVVYVMFGFIAYRLFVVPLAMGSRAIGLTALAVVMLFNALWNYALFQSQDLLVGLLGLIAFVAPLTILQVALLVYDRRSARALGFYVGWVVFYDIPLYYSMWQLHSN